MDADTNTPIPRKTLLGAPCSALFGDCLDVMQGMDSETVDLIYIDPPYYSQADYKGDAGAFSDKWESLHQYLDWMVVRLYEMKRLLKPTGSIYLHCDWHASHYLKVEMDKIFSYDNFVNEIVWCYKSGGASKKSFSKKHDNILFYSKTKNGFFFNSIKEKSYMGFNYSTGNKNVTLYDDDDGRGKYTMVNPKDWWEIGMLATSSKERIGYPTQKPEALLERIIRSSCPDGGTVADFFCGSGTTAAVARRMGRKWITCDNSQDAINLATKRIFSLPNAQMNRTKGGIELDPDYYEICKARIIK